MSGAVVLGAWILALGVVAAPLAGLPEADSGALAALDRFGLVACLALVAASSPRAPAGPHTTGPGAAALATIVLFLPLAAVAAELDAQAGRERAPIFALLVLAFASALAWSAERARRDGRSAARYGGAWVLLLGLPAVAATLFATTSSFAWSPLVWSLGPRELRHTLAPAAAVALLVGSAAGRAAPREA